MWEIKNPLGVSSPAAIEDLSERDLRDSLRLRLAASKQYFFMSSHELGMRNSLARFFNSWLPPDYNPDVV